MLTNGMRGQGPLLVLLLVVTVVMIHVGIYNVLYKQNNSSVASTNNNFDLTLCDSVCKNNVNNDEAFNSDVEQPNNNNNNEHLTNIQRYQDKKDSHYDKVLDFTGKRFAYAFYVTQEPYLCMAAISAHRIRGWTDYDIVFVITENYTPNPLIMDRLQKLPNVYIKRLPNIRAKHDSQHHYFSDSLNKLYVFNLVEYDRIIFLDADTYIMKNLDHLFALPDVTLASPLGYWFDHRPFMTNILMVLKPSKQAFDKIMKVAETHPGWDMDIINDIYLNSDEFLLLPSIYGMLNVEFSTTDKHFFGEDLNETFYNKTILFHYTGFKPWLVQGNGPQVSGHGELYSKTWQLWNDAANQYCR